MTAWEAFAAHHKAKMCELPVLFEDVSIVQAVPVAPGGAVTLSVTLSVLVDRSHRFEARPPSLFIYMFCHRRQQNKSFRRF